MTTNIKVPRVLWAQRKDVVYLTFEVVEAQNEKLDIQSNTINFAAEEGNTGNHYNCTLELFDEIDPTQTQQHKTDRLISVVLKKADDNKSFWPRLVKSGKPHFVHTDFSRWKDEDEISEGDLDPKFGKGGFGGDDMDFSQFASMAGSGGFPTMGGHDEEEFDEAEDSDDAEEDPYQKTPKDALKAEDE